MPKQQSSDFNLVGPVFDFAQPPTKKEYEYLEAYKSWVYSAVTAIAREVSQIKLHLYKKKYIYRGRQKDVEIEEVYEHEALSLLFFVNNFMTFSQFIEITQTYLDLVGEAAWAILRSGEKPDQLWPLRPDWISIKGGKTADDYISHYIYYPGGIYEQVKIETKDMIWLKYLNPVNPYRGKGAVQAAAMAIDIDEFSSEYNRTFFFNSAMPSIFFSTDKKIGDNEAKRLMEMWRSKFEGRKNAHKVAFLGSGLKPLPVGGSLKDLDFIPGKRYLRDEILAAFHISKANLGIVEDVNRANQEATDARFKAKVVKPRMVSLVQYLNEFYLKNWPDEGLFFDFDDPVPEDVELKLKIYESGLKNGWLTPNEVREEENRPPFEGGDNVYLPFSLQPVGAVEGIKNFLLGKNKDKKSALVVMKAKKKTKQEKLKDSLSLSIPPQRLNELRKEKLKKGIEHNLIKLVVNLMKLSGNQATKIKTKKDVKQQLNKEGKETFWRGMVAKTDVQEQRMRGYLFNLFKEQEKEVYQRIENTAKAMKLAKKDIVKMVFSLKDEDIKCMGSVGKYINEIVIEKGEEIFDFLGMPRKLDLTTQRAVGYLKSDGVKFISSANETTRNLLIEALTEGVAEGEGIPELKRRVEQIFTAASTHRTEAIARTEVLRATNFATDEAYRQSEIVQGKEWLTALDERVCPWCNEMDAKVKGLNEDFFKVGDTFEVNGRKMEVSYENITHPPLHPQCRCTLIPVIK